MKRLKRNLKLLSVLILVAFVLSVAQCSFAPYTPQASDDTVEGDDAVGKDIVIVAAKDSSPEARAQADFICDGINDNIEIQAAIDAVNTSGTVTLLEGTYLISSPQISLKSNMTLQGQGYETLLKATGEFNDGVILIRGVTDVIVRDLRVDANEISGYAIAIADSWAAIAQRITVENVWAFNANDDEITAVHGAEDIIIRNSVFKGSHADPLGANIEVGDEVKRVTISGNTVLGDAEGRKGIKANSHPPEWGVGEDIVITNNIIEGIKSDGMILEGNRITVSNNTLSDIGGNGITTVGGVGYTITDNVVTNVTGAGIYPWGQELTITGNQITEARRGGILVGGDSDSILLEDNFVQDSKEGGIKVEPNSSNITMRNNTCQNNGASGIWIGSPATDVTIENNRVSGPKYGITLGTLSRTRETISRVILRDNDFDDNAEGWMLLIAIVKNLEVYPPPSHPTVTSFDAFRNCLVASTNYVHTTIAGTGAEQEITSNIINPDVPRNISITTTNNAALSGDVIIDGINARGDADSERIAIVVGGTAYGNKAFATITKITIPPGVSAADTIEIGISDKLGLSHIIDNTSDVYRLERNTHSLWPIPPIDVANGTIDFAPITANDSFDVWYKGLLNTVD